MPPKSKPNITNSDVAQKFNEIADLLEIERANPFRVRAYRKAAFALVSWGRSVSEMLEKREDLTIIPNIGKDLATKIQEIVKSGELSLLEETEKRVPRILGQLMKIDGLGPKRVKMLYDELNI